MAVLSDMIEGVVVANLLLPPHADRVRADLWQAVGRGPTIQPSGQPSGQPVRRVA
jgi:hypothetical protein